MYIPLLRKTWGIVVMHFPVDMKGAKYFTFFPLLSVPLCSMGFCSLYYSTLEQALLSYSVITGKGTVCCPRVCFLLRASDQGDKSRGQRTFFTEQICHDL